MKHQTWTWTCLFALLLAAPAAAAPPATPAVRADPEAAGLLPAKLVALREGLQKLVDGRQIAGAVTLIGRRGHVGSIEAVGFRDLESRAPMVGDTVFQIASMTKIATSVAVLALEDDGKLSTDDPVEKHLPEFRNQKLLQPQPGDTFKLAAPERPITIKDLLTHTSGMRCDFPPGFAEGGARRSRPLAEGVAAYGQHPLEAAPGSRWKYCGPPFDTLGRIVEVAARQPLDAFMEERVFRPLGMKDTTFNPTPAQRARLAVLYHKAGDGIARTEGNAGQPARYLSPSGGLYSTAADYGRLMQMLLDGGAAGDRRILRPQTVAKMTTVHFATGPKVGFTPGLGMGLGVQVVMQPQDVTADLLPGSFGHGGAYGTQAWADPRRQMYFVLMIQRQGFGNGDMSDVRKLLQAAGVAALAADAAAGR